MLSFDCDYQDLARQVGKIGSRIIKGEPPSSIKPSNPEKVTYSLNLKTARSINLSIPEEQKKKAKPLFDE